MAKRGRSIEDQLDEFDPPPPRRRLGNIDDDDETPPLERIAQGAANPTPDSDLEQDEPVVEQVSTATPEPTPEPAAEPEPSPADKRLAELEERLTARERELEFLRAGYVGGQQAAQPVAQPQPADGARLIDQYLGNYQVTAEDIQRLVDPETGPAYAQNFLRAAAAAGASMALQQARSEFQQYQEQQQSSLQLRNAFYGKYPELGKYARLVEQEAVALRAANPNLPTHSPQFIDETARRAKAQLKEWGVTPEKPASGTTARSERIRPAFSESGAGGGGHNGRKPQTKLERQMAQFDKETDTWFGRA